MSNLFKNHVLVKTFLLSETTMRHALYLNVRWHTSIFKYQLMMKWRWKIIAIKSFKNHRKNIQYKNKKLLSTNHLCKVLSAFCWHSLDVTAIVIQFWPRFLKEFRFSLFHDIMIFSLSDQSKIKVNTNPVITQSVISNQILPDTWCHMKKFLARHWCTLYEHIYISWYHIKRNLIFIESYKLLITGYQIYLFT